MVPQNVENVWLHDISTSMISKTKLGHYLIDSLGEKQLWIFYSLSWTQSYYPVLAILVAAFNSVRAWRHLLIVLEFADICV